MDSGGVINEVVRGNEGKGKIVIYERKEREDGGRIKEVGVRRV